MFLGGGGSFSTGGPGLGLPNCRTPGGLLCEGFFWDFALANFALETCLNPKVQTS